MAGADDVRNGLSLCRLHHWAFDNMLLGISTGRMIVCPPPVAVLAGNAALAQLDGAPLIAPEDDELAVDDFAIGWAYERFDARSEEHTSELQSLMRISYAVFCLKKKKKITTV